MMALHPQFVDVQNSAAETFGALIREHRQLARLTVEQLAKKVGVSKQHLSVIERGQPHPLTGKPVTPKLELVDKLAESLGVDVNSYRLAAGYASTHQAQTFDIADKARLALLDKDLSPEDAAEIIEEMTIAYNVIMERRRLRAERENTHNDKR